MAKIKATTDGKKGGLLYGKSHAQGGIKAVVTDAGNKEIELEGGEAVVKKSALKDKTVKTLTGTNAEILNKINTEAGGNPIYAPSDVKMKNGGKISGNIEMKGSNIYADKTINEETDFIAEYLEGNGFFIRKGARSRTDFGESNYLYAHNKIDASGFPEGEGIKIRISDHSVFNFDRMNNEIHVGVTATKDSWEKSAFSVLMQLQWYYDKTNKFRKEDEIEIKKVNIEVPESQLRKNPPYPDKILSERISKSGKKQITVERTYSYPIEKWYHKESGKYYTTIKPNTFEEGGSVNTDIISPYLENLKINGIVLYDKDLIVLMYNTGSQKRNKNLYSPSILRKYLNNYSEEVANQLTLDLAMDWYDLFDEKDIPKYLKHDRIIVVNNSKVVFDNQANMAKGGSITPRAISKMTKAEQKAFYKTKEGKELDKQTHAKWKSLVNMSKGELESFYNSKEGKEAGLSASEAKAEGIDSGRESARWIMKMKDIPYTEWTSNMWVWAKKQISFVSRMKGMKGDLYDDKGNKTRKHLALLIWGHNPKKMAEGGSIESDCISFIKKSEAIKNNGYFHYFKNTSVYANFGAKDPKVKSFYLCSYNSGGQKNLKVTDTINLDLVNKLQSIIGCEKGVCIIIIDEFMRKAKRVEKNDLKRMARENILVVDRDKVTCDNINSKMAEGGNVGDSKLLAPNGKPSNLTAEQYKLVRTAAFKKWFGDWENDAENASKVVDENGEPLVVYHGTASDFNIFKIGRTGGIFFTNNKNSAERFSSGDLKRIGSNPKTLNCFLNIKKYYDKNTNDKILVDNYYQNYFQNRPFIKKQSQKNILKNKFNKYFMDLVFFGVVNEEPLNFLIEKGYDGIIIDADNNSNSYIVFNSNQIKLADGTNTTFDGSNDDIRFAEGGNIDDDFDWNLLYVMGDDSEPNESDSVKENRIIAEVTLNSLENKKNELEKQLNDWKGRTYKKNSEVVYAKGDDILGDAYTIGGINEARKLKRIKSLSNQITVVDKSISILKEINIKSTVGQSLYDYVKDGWDNEARILKLNRKNVSLKEEYVLDEAYDTLLNHIKDNSADKMAEGGNVVEAPTKTETPTEEKADESMSKENLLASLEGAKVAVEFLEGQQKQDMIDYIEGLETLIEIL